MFTCNVTKIPSKLEVKKPGRNKLKTRATIKETQHENEMNRSIAIGWKGLN